jgi:hypothetical protein
MSSAILVTCCGLLLTAILSAGAGLHALSRFIGRFEATMEHFGSALVEHKKEVSDRFARVEREQEQAREREIEASRVPPVRAPSRSRP